MSVDSWGPVWELREAEGLCAVQALSELTGLRCRQAAPRLLWANGQRSSRQVENQQGAASFWLFYISVLMRCKSDWQKRSFLTVETHETRVWNPAPESDGHEQWGSSKRISLGGEEEAFRTVQGEVLMSSELHRLRRWSLCLTVLFSVIGLYCLTIKTGDKLIFSLVNTDRSLRFHC